MKNKAVSLGGLLLVAGFCLSARAAGEALERTGTWSLNNWVPGDSLHLTLSYRASATRWEWGNDQPIADLHGLTSEQLHSAHASVAFTLQRDAGTFAFEGRLLLGIGRGEYRFVPDPSYAAKLGVLGYEAVGGDDIALMLMATRDISLAYASEVKLSGLRIDAVSDLVRLRDHGVGLDFIRELAASGSVGFTADDVVRLRDHGVEVRFIRALKTSGYSDLSAADIVRLHDHGIDGRFVAALADSGCPRLQADALVKLKDHGVDPEYIARVRSAGYENLTVDQIIELHDHGVD